MRIRPIDAVAGGSALRREIGKIAVDVQFLSDTGETANLVAAEFRRAFHGTVFSKIGANAYFSCLEHRLTST